MDKRNSQMKISATVLPIKIYNEFKGLLVTFLQFLHMLVPKINSSCGSSSNTSSTSKRQIWRLYICMKFVLKNAYRNKPGHCPVRAMKAYHIREG
jgi:hypothetical protein